MDLRFWRRKADDEYSGAIGDPFSTPPRPGAGGRLGANVNVDTAQGMPAVTAAIRILSESFAMLDTEIVEKRDGVWTPVDDAPQHRLLCESPNALQSGAFGFYEFGMSSLQGWGGAYAQKVRSLVRGAGSEVLELLPIPPHIVRPVMKKGELLFRVRTKDGLKELSRSEILYVPGFLLDSPYIGVSPITKHREALGREIAREDWATALYDNRATPDIAVTLPGPTTPQQRKEFRESWNMRHQGGPNAHGMALLWNGASIEAIGVTPKDAEYVATANLGVRDVARIFRMDSGWLGDPDAKMDAVSPEHASMRLLTYTLGPWRIRWRDALWSDPDIFPDRRLRPNFPTEALRQVDLKTQTEAEHHRRQAGVMTANEIRRPLGLPDHPDGDELQATPVGGAPNPGAPSILLPGEKKPEGDE